MVRWRSVAKRLAVWLVVVAMVASTAVVWYGGSPHEATPGRLDAVRDDPDVVIEKRDGSWLLRDADPDGDRVGLVFYPGGRVEAAAYLWTLAPLVERTDVRVIVPKFPFHLAVLAPGRAGSIVHGGPDIDAWYVGGHSLGGAMACRFAANNPARVAGVVLLAAYCSAGDSLRGTDLAALAVTGSRDGVLDRERFRAFRRRAPDRVRFATLEGVNHAQFGAYGAQPGDRAPAVSDRVARQRLTALLIAWFRARPG